MCCGNSWANNFRFSAIFSVPIGGVVGATTGGMIGIRRWDPVPRITGRR